MSVAARDLFLAQTNYLDALFMFGDKAISTNWALGALRAQAAYVIELACAPVTT